MEGSRPASLVGAAYAAWMTGFGAISFLLGGDETRVRSLWLGLLPALLLTQLLILPHRPWRQAGGAALALPLLFLLALAPGILGNLERGADVLVVAALGLLFGCALLASLAGPALLLAICRHFAWMATLLLLLVMLKGDYAWGRLVGHDQPNSWARIAMTAALFAFAWRHWLPRAAIWLALLPVLYVTQSRGTEAALLGALAAGFLRCDLPRIGRLGLGLACLGAAAAIGAAVAGLAADPLLAERVSRPIEQKLLHSDDRSRGGGTDLSGRGEMWRITTDIWLEAPLTGVGYRKHDLELYRRLGSPPHDRPYSAHNAYLAMLADAGLFGLAAYLAMLLAGLWRGAVLAPASPAGRICFQMLVAFALVGLVERLSVNTGNAPSIGFVLCLFALLATRLPCRPAAGVPV